MFLVVLSGKQQGKVIQVEKDGVLGREPSVDYPIDDPTVSRRHAEILHAADGWRLRDLGSANGTELNGARLIGDRLLREGDVVGLGRATLVFNAQVSGTQRQPNPTAIDQTQGDAGLIQIEAGLAQRMLAALKNNKGDPDAQARDALAQLLMALPGAVRASLVDWKAGRVLARAPQAAEISRGTVMRAIGELKSHHDGVAVWNLTERQAVAAKYSVAEVAAFVALPVEAGVGVLIEGSDDEQTLPPGSIQIEQLIDAAMLMRIPLAAIRLQVAAGSRKLRDADLRLAQRIQMHLLSPAPTDLAGFNLALSYTPAMMVGGDFYHFDQRSNDELAVVIGDVSGKGVSGAMYMAFLVADLRHHVRVCNGPGELLERLQGTMTKVLEPGMFVTVCAVYVNTRTGMCRVGLAGHSAPVLRTSARKVMEMGLDPGLPIGAQDGMTVKEQRLQLAPGDCLVLTTDGVDEGENNVGEAYGKARRDLVLVSCSSADEINQALRKSLLEFVGRDRSSDDLTIICLERLR
jgi:serine phosphatase RsbU (regulator of sigma subunit)